MSSRVDGSAVALGRLIVTSIDVPARTLNTFAALISAEEQQRAARFRFEKHRRRYVAARANLRLVLSAELGVAAQDVHFDYGPQGKPLLAGELGKIGVSFNLSHSGDLALIGVCRGGEVGVDLEIQRPLADADQLAQRYFSTQELAAYLAAPAAQRTAEFFNCWTRKEALLKARGQGLAAIASLSGDMLPDWSCWNFDAAPGFAAAVAVHRRNCDLKAEAPASSRVRLGPDSA